MRWLGGTTLEGRVDLPDLMAREGGAWDGVRGRSFLALVDATTVGCLPWERCPRSGSHQDGRRMRGPGMPPAGLPGDDLSRQDMRSLRRRSDA